ncbi:dihydrofolate reductase [Massilia forsythiae]|uniref:Dihydrofolate reductase n=1 Tax=Massilia forsythiae TaxID=2728020 RepID=A0A7Z2ZUM5_9BURK|nr:dihydrofolate reductase [Massilia forsythiae]QJE02559.1 dihydrofolate reductase [Massilia forsythiae]
MADQPVSHLTLVVAMDAQRGIGVDNRLPWHLPQDLAHFKRVTLGQPVIMGRKTFDSIGRALPGRRNIVVTRNPDWSHAGVETAHSLQDAVRLLDGAPASIIGGAQVFAEAMDLAGRMIVTHIERTYRCDTFFPDIDPARWTATARELQHAPEDDLDFSFVTYQKIK